MKICVDDASRIFRNERGQSIISSLIAAGIIVGSITAVVLPAMKLQDAIKKTEIANVAVMVEANLVDSFNNKLNYPDDTQVTTSLRAGTLPTAITLQTSFANLTLGRGVSSTFLSTTGYLSRAATPCVAYDYNCVIKYEVRLGRGPTGSFAYTYRVEANPAFSNMAPIGSLATYPASPPSPPEEGLLAVDPGLYRVTYVKNICDPATDIFMTGMNRDTGEAFCVEKPLTTKCADGHLPKGLNYVEYGSGAKAGKLEFVCESGALRTMSCQTNYSLQSFSPQALDPESAATPGTCVFRTARSASMPQSFPPNPTSPYVRRVSGTFCPPYYKAGDPGSCSLVENAVKNAQLNVGSAKCADTAYKDCSRWTYRYEMRSDGGAAHASWVYWMNYYSTNEPFKTLIATYGASYGWSAATWAGAEPANPEWVDTLVCSSTQYSRYCNGSVTSGGAYCPSGSDSGWSSGTPYATNIQIVAPSARTVSSFSGRVQTCVLQDTSPACGAPDLDFNDRPWGKGNPKWYGGIQVSGTSCSLDTGSYAETVRSSIGP